MPPVGIILRLTHTGKAGDSILITDLGDGTDRNVYRKVGAVYVPRLAPDKVSRGYIDLTYSTDVALSFRDQGIRKFIEGGYLEAEFVFGPLMQQAASGTVVVTSSPYAAQPNDRSIFWCPTTPGPLTVTLPKITEHYTHSVQIVDVQGIATAHTITVLPDSTVPDTINGGASETITTNYGQLTLYADCVSNWTDIGSGGGGPAVGGGRVYQFSQDKRVPNAGTLYLLYGVVASSSAPFTVDTSANLRAVSISVDTVDTKNYDLEIVVNGSVTDTLLLAAGNTEAYTSSFTTAVAAGDNISVRLVRATGTGRSVFSDSAVSLVIDE